jgi:hypothetical protein
LNRLLSWMRLSSIKSRRNYWNCPLTILYSNTFCILATSHCFIHLYRS